MNPHELEARPRHRATEAEQEDFLEMVGELGLIAAHLGGGFEFHASFRLPRPPRKRKAKPEGGTP